jgi:hypothetical protein
MREPLAAQRQLATKTNPKTKGFSNCRLRLSSTYFTGCLSFISFGRRPTHHFQSREFCGLFSITYYFRRELPVYCGFGGESLKPEPDQPTADVATPQPVPQEADPDVHTEKPKK